MSIIYPRFLKSIYRKEPLSSFLIIMGVVDATIGGVGGYGSLLFLGLTVIGGAVALRWRQIQRHSELQPEQVPQHYLPPKSSQDQLPMLSIAKKRPPN